MERKRERRTVQQPWRKQTPRGGSKMAIKISQKISQRFTILTEGEGERERVKRYFIRDPQTGGPRRGSLIIIFKT